MRRVGIVLCSLLVLALPCTSQNTSPHGVSDLQYFLGEWDCAGKFARSGASIEAHLKFEAVLDQKFVLFRHDDKPPHNYHALAEWGWDESGKRFVSTVQDSSGGTRLFHSSGWQGEQLTWEGGAVGGADDQQFLFEKISPQQFRISYAVQKNGSWAPVDVSTCTRGS
jgi:Protein of unknown function (DUF1579)